MSFAGGTDTPASYRIDKERRLVLSTAAGALAKKDFLEHQKQLAKDPDFDPSFSQLADFREVTSFEVSAEELRSFAEKSLFDPHSRRAFLVKDDLGFGLARMFQILRELDGEPGIGVFRRLDDALEWLRATDAAR